MCEKRFSVRLRSECDGVVYSFFDGNKLLDVDMIVDLLNEQHSTIEQLKAQLREKEEDERLYANEIVKLNKEAKEVLDFKSLGGDY